MIDEIIKAFEDAKEHEDRCGYISITLELRDKIVESLKGLNKVDDSAKETMPPV